MVARLPVYLRDVEMDLSLLSKKTATAVVRPLSAMRIALGFNVAMLY